MTLLEVKTYKPPSCDMDKTQCLQIGHPSLEKRASRDGD